ncbi:hypothetical protein B0H14DRAFT_2573953 [Mycena olivaceomarginata]|nr:hypothetical protein B0H14DRAFT_2573953 [Mycena olivaceomarginata]
MANSTTTAISSSLFANPEESIRGLHGMSPAENQTRCLRKFRFHLPSEFMTRLDGPCRILIPPSAGIDSYVGPIRFVPKGSCRHTISTTNYPYKPRHTSASPMLPGAALKIKQPHPPHSSSAGLRDVLDGQYSVRNSEFEPDEPMLLLLADPPYLGSEMLNISTTLSRMKTMARRTHPQIRCCSGPLTSSAFAPPGPCICGARPQRLITRRRESVFFLRRHFADSHCNYPVMKEKEGPPPEATSFFIPIFETAGNGPV